MADNRIGMNLVTVKNGQDAGVLPENLDRLSRAGFRGVGIWVSTVTQWKESGRSVSDLAKELEDRNLAVDELCFVGVLNADGTVADRRREFEWASELGAPAVISIIGDPSAPIEKVRDDWGEYVRRVEDIGVAAAFEFIGPWPQYNSPARAWEAIKAGPELGTMVFDTFHFWRGGCDLTEIEQVPGQRVSLVHLNDAKDMPREEANDSDRTYPGRGVIPLREILSGLRRAGFTGPLSMEIFGEVQEMDPDEVCADAYEAARGLLAGL
jgi:sugar phosphate isomerase/epimerase